MTGLLEGWQLEAREPDDFSAGLKRTLAEFGIAAFIIAAWGFATWSLYRASAIEKAAISRRTAVIAQLSHELRTPLANMRLYLDLIDRRAAEADSVRNYATILDSEVSRLEQLSENAILAARGSVAPPMLERGIPDDALAAIVARYQPLMRQSGCDLTFQGAARHSCTFDRTGLERVAVNLLDNARKYAPGTAIEMSTTTHDGRLRVSVRDHGPGIPDALKARLFEPLSRGDHARAAGFGLGLWTVQSVAQQNGGRAEVEDAHPGTRIIVEIGVGAGGSIADGAGALATPGRAQLC